MRLEFLKREPQKFTETLLKLSLVQEKWLRKELNKASSKRTTDFNNGDSKFGPWELHNDFPRLMRGALFLTCFGFFEDWTNGLADLLEPIANGKSRRHMKDKKLRHAIQAIQGKLKCKLPGILGEQPKMDFAQDLKDKVMHCRSRFSRSEAKKYIKVSMGTSMEDWSETLLSNVKVHPISGEIAFKGDFLKSLCGQLVQSTQQLCELIEKRHDIVDSDNIVL